MGSDYDAFVEMLVREAVEAGKGSLASLAQSLPGVFPSEIDSVVRRLGLSVRSTPQQGAVTRVAGPVNRRWLPHPLDYDWRFTKKACMLLAEAVARHAPPVVLLGTPSLVRPALEVGARDLLLLDRQAAAIAASPQCRCLPLDVMTEMAPPLDARLVIADPPWYPEHLAAFVRAASKVLRMGGECWMSIPGIGTRPNIEDERLSLTNVAAAAGFELLDLQEGAFAYETPFFEFNALRASGVSPYMQRWRRGDRWILRKVRESGRAVRPKGDPDGTWVETRIGSTRWRVRLEPAIESPELHINPICESRIVPSVSRRFPERGKANVWTTGNRAFLASNPASLMQVLLRLRDSYRRRVRRADTSLGPVEVEIERAVRDEQEELLEYEAWIAEGLDD